MTPEQWRNSGREDDPIAFTVVEMPSCPPQSGKMIWCEWMRHIDGREVLLLRDVIGRDLIGGEHWHDYIAHVAFGPESCHACVCNWASGSLDDGEYRPHRTTTDKTPRLRERATPCNNCRARYAKKTMDDAAKIVLDRFGIGVTWTMPEQWIGRASIATITPCRS